MKILRFAAIVAICLGLADVASAQRRVPATGSAAVGGDAGIFIPIDEPLGTGPTLEGFYEYYLNPRTSVRFGLGWASPHFDREDEDSLRLLRVPFDVVYNWEGGAIHPFVGAGLGAYFVQEQDNGRSVGDLETKLGATLFGGAEFFTGRTVSVKAEARYHILGDVRGVEPDGLGLTIGLKKYF
jgi:hypothetical protein